MKKILIFVLLINALSAGAQTVNVINRNQPIKEVTFEWNNNNNLVIKAVLDHKKVLPDEIVEPYVDQGSISIQLNSNGYFNDRKILDNTVLTGVSRNDEPNQIIYTLSNLHLGYNSPIRNNEWSSFKFRFSFFDKGFGSKAFQVLEFPLFKGEANIPRPGVNISLTTDKFYFNNSEVVLQFYSNSSDFRFSDIIIESSQDGRQVAAYNANDSRNIVTGNKLQAYFIPQSTIVAGNTYHIRIISNTGLSYSLDDRISKVVEFKALGFNIVDGLNSRPLLNPLVLDKQKRTIEIITNATNDGLNINSSDLKLELVREPFELHSRNTNTFYNLTIDQSNGKIRQLLNLDQLEDGLYRLQFSGGIKDVQNNPKTLVLEKPQYMIIDSSNSLNSLTFSYSKDEVIINFGLARILPEGKVGIREKGRYDFKSSSFDTNAGLYSNSINDFNRDQFNRYEILVSNNLILDFSFKVVSEDAVNRVISKAIQRRINIEDNGRKAMVYLESHSDELKRDIVSEVQKSLISNGDPILEKQKDEFLSQLESMVEKTLEEVAQSQRRTLDDKNFWETTFGKITKSVGGLALRYLGVVVA